jgi:hypothetical protein
MTVSVQFKPKPGVAKKVLTPDVRRDLVRRGRKVETGAKRRCSVLTGRLRSSITMTTEQENGLPIVRIGTNVHYGIWVHEGRGPVTPVRADFLVFKVRGGSGLVYARAVRATKGNPFLRDALQDARD